MKKILFMICIILPLIFMSCTNKVVDGDKPEEKPNTTENTNKNDEIKKEDPIKNEEEPKESAETETDTPKDVEVTSPIEPLIDSRFGYLDLIYTENDDYYLSLDEAEIFFDKEALAEAVIDGNAGYHEDGRAFLPDPYYIRNNYDTLSTFKIDQDTKFYLCGFALEGDRNDNSIDLYEVSLEEFRKYTSKEYEPGQFRTGPSRCKIWVDLQDGVAIKLYQQFTP